MRTYLSVWMFLLLCFTACSDNEDVSTGDNPLTVRLVLNMPAAQVDEVSGEDPEAVGNDNWLHPHDVKLLAYDTDGTFAGRAIMSTLTPLVGDPSGRRYTLTGTLTGLDKKEVEDGGEFRLVVLCNLSGACRVEFPFSTVPTDTEAELYGKLSFEYPIDNGLTHKVFEKEDSGRIPMWGKKTTALTDKSMIEIDMLRAMAKVKVCLGEELTGDPDMEYTLEGVTVRHCHTQGFITPKGAANMTDTPTDNQTEINLAGEFHNEIAFHEHPAGSGEFYIYLPEQKKGTPDKKEGSWMDVRINGHTYELRFGDYETNTLFPVVRNHYYVFTITGISTSHDLIYQVCPWEEKTAGDIEFS